MEFLDFTDASEEERGLLRECLSSRGDNSELAEKFEQLSDAQLQVLLNQISERSLADIEELVFKKLEVMHKEERNTWRLAKALCSENLLNRTREDSGDKTILMNPGLSEDQLIGNIYIADQEIRRMQIVVDWLEANEASDLDYRDKDDKVEFYSEGPTAWENTLHAMRTSHKVNISDERQSGIDFCSAMDPDVPIRTKKSLVYADKEVEIKLFRHLFKFLRAGNLPEGQELARKVGYYWLAAILDGWLPYSDPNLDEENIDAATFQHSTGIQPVSGNRKRDIWKQLCFKIARMQGLNSYEKAILGVLGGNLKSSLPVCQTWSDQLWARLRCSIDIKIEKALHDPTDGYQEGREEFYENYQDLQGIFKSIKDLKIISPLKEATIHQTVQRYLILNDIDGLLDQLEEWSGALEFDINLAMDSAALSPQFLRCFSFLVLFLRNVGLIAAEDGRGIKIIESYIQMLIKQKSIENVAHYTLFLPRENQIYNYAKLLATIDELEERRHCLSVARECELDLDEITQTAVEMIRNEQPTSRNVSMSEMEMTKTTTHDKRKINALDYLLLLESRNFVAILYHGNSLLRKFAVQRKMDAVKETFLKLPMDLNESVENWWRIHTNSEVTPSLRNNMRELEGFRVIIQAQEELTQWSEQHHKRPEEPKKPANLSKFCDHVNYEQRLKQYQDDLSLWKESRIVRTKELARKIKQLYLFPGGWMKDLPSDQQDTTNNERIEQLNKLRKIFIPHMAAIHFNVLQLTDRHDKCLKISHVLARDDLRLYEEFTKLQLRDFLDKISEITKILVRKSIVE